MLPFLKQKQEASVVSTPDVVRRKSDDESEEYDSMHAAAEDLIAAIKANDVPGCAEALRAAFDLASDPPAENHNPETE